MLNLPEEIKLPANLLVGVASERPEMLLISEHNYTKEQQKHIVHALSVMLQLAMNKEKELEGYKEVLTKTRERVSHLESGMRGLLRTI